MRSGALRQSMDDGDAEIGRCAAQGSSIARHEGSVGLTPAVGSVCSRAVRERDGDVVGDTALGEVEHHVAAEFALDAAADQARSEALALRRRHGRSSAFGPVYPKLIVAVFALSDRPGHFESARIGRKRAILGSIRHQLVQDKAEIDGVAGGELHVRPAQNDPLVALLAVGRQLLLRHVAQLGLAPGLAGQQVVRLRQGEQAALESVLELRRRLGGAQRLRGDGLHGGQGVLHPVVQLVEEEALLLLGVLLLGDVLEDADEIDRLFFDIEEDPALGVDPADARRPQAGSDIRPRNPPGLRRHPAISATTRSMSSG